MDILNNREWALLIWVIPIAIFILFFQKVDEIRESLKELIQAFFVGSILRTLTLMTIYISFVIYGLFKIGLWELHQLKNTIIWSISVGAVSLLRINSIKAEPSFFKKVVFDNLKLIVIIQFVLEFYTYSLTVELILTPILITVVGMLTIAQTNPKLHVVEKFLNGVMVIYGGFLVSHSIYMLATNFSEFAQKQTIYDFYIPPLLTFLYFPFLFSYMVFITYETVFSRVHSVIKDLKVRRFAKIYSLLKFHFRFRLLERWANILRHQNTSSKEGIVQSINQIFKMIKTEKNPPEIPSEKGWSPYKAKDFLLKEGVATGYYHPIGEDEWMAISSFIEIDDGIIPNKISYYIVGTEKEAKSLKILLDVQSIKSANQAHAKLLSSVRTLLAASLNLDLPKEIKMAIKKGENQEFKLGHLIANIEKNIWSKKPFIQYNINFVLSCPETTSKSD